MPKHTRIKTKYPGVTYLPAKAPNGDPDRIYYIRYRKGGKMVEEKAGTVSKDKMTPAKANQLRADKISGKEPTNAEKRAAIEAAKKAAEGRVTIERLWEAYQEQNPGLKGWGTYKSQWNAHLKEAFEDKEPENILQLDIDRFRLRLLKKRKPQTVKHCLSLLNRLVRFGVRKQMCRPLAFEVELPRFDNRKTEDLSKDQLKRLLAAIEKDTHAIAGPLMKLALYSGMRKNEMLRLRWADIDFEKGFITIRNPKSGRDQVIPMNDMAAGVLKALQRVSDWVFPGKDGKHRVEVTRACREIATAAGLPPGFRPLHGLRHCFASALASSGKVDLLVLQRLLTHRDPAMTLRYSHLRDEALRRASDIAGDIFKTGTEGK